MRIINPIKEAGPACLPSLEPGSPLYFRNFLVSRIPNQIILSRSVSELIPELSQTPVENFYWVLGRYVGQDYLALDTRFAAYGSPAGVPILASDFLSFNKELQKFSQRLPDFAIAPLHNHPDVLQYVAESGLCLPSKFMAEIDQYLGEMIERLSAYSKLKPEQSGLNISSLKRLLVACEYQPQNLSNEDLQIIMQLKAISQESSLMLSDLDCSLGSAFHFLCPFTETVNGRHKGITASVVDCDLTDLDDPVFSANHRLIPIKSEV